DGRPVDIPARDWPYLELYEEGKRDAIKFDALDKQRPYTRVHLKRDDLLRLWPAQQAEVGQTPLAENIAGKTKLHQEILRVANPLWPDGAVPPRIKERNSAIQKEFGIPPSARTIHRAFK